MKYEITPDDSGKEAMLQACRAGDLSHLESLLKDTSGQDPDIHALLITAVSHQHPNIVAYLLKANPTLCIGQSTDIVASLVTSGNVPILKILLAHDPQFASISIDSGFRSFLTDSCLSSPSITGPLIHVLLDAGGDVNDGQGPGGGSLLAALMGGQERDIVEKIVKKGGLVNARILQAAIQKERVDVLPILLRRAGSSIDKVELRQWAEQTGNEDVQELIETFTQDGTTGMAKYEKESEGNTVGKPHWWEVWKSEK